MPLTQPPMLQRIQEAFLKDVFSKFVLHTEKQNVYEQIENSRKQQIESTSTIIASDLHDLTRKW